MSHYLEPRPTTGTFTVPIGFLHNGKRYREVMLKEMTGDDEDIIASDSPSEVKFASIIANCLTGFVEEGAPERLTASQLLSLPLIDRNYILVGLRVLSIGRMYKFKAECPGCGSIEEREQDLMDLAVTSLSDKPWSFTLSTGRKVTVGVATGHDARWITQATKKLGLKAPSASIFTAATLTAIDDIPLSKDLGKIQETITRMKQLTLNERAEIREYALSLGGDFDRTMEIECSKCGQEFKYELTIGEGFFSR